MKLFLYDLKILFTVSKNIFRCCFNKSLVHQVIMSYMSINRQSTHSQKTRSEVSGSNKKPWRQKGTGRARVGSIRSPIWRSGGVTFTSRFKNYKKKINKKMYHLALKNIMSELFRQNRLIFFKDFFVKSTKTILLLKKVNSFFLKNILIITNEFNENLFLSARNLYNIKVCNFNNINLIDLINFNNVVITTDIIKKFEDLFNDS